ncbi:hypothetical protein Hypma_004033, partial [Hypsizygus marmoreus]
MRLCHILGTSSKNLFATFVKGRNAGKNMPLSIKSDNSYKQTTNATCHHSLTTVPMTSTKYISTHAGVVLQLHNNDHLKVGTDICNERMSTQGKWAVLILEAEPSS